MGTLYVVATPIGNLKDVSERMLKTLTEVDLIVAEDTRQTIKLLNYFGIHTRMESYHKFNEKKKGAEIIEKIKNGLNVALVSDAGTPCISDPGGILVKYAREQKIDVIGIPGPSAVVTSLSISGLSVDRFLFMGFLPTEKKEKLEMLEMIQKQPISTVVFYESPKRLVVTVELFKHYFPNSKVSICSDLTKVHERNFFGEVDDVFEIICKDPTIEKGEYVIVLEKKEVIEETNEEEMTIEALLIDVMFKKKCSLKEAISSLSEEKKDIKKNDIYQASLSLKSFIKDVF